MELQHYSCTQSSFDLAPKWNQINFYCILYYGRKGEGGVEEKQKIIKNKTFF